MKPIVKICIALSCVLFLLGAAGIAAGMAMGVTPSQLLRAAHAPGRFPLRMELDGDIREDISDGLPDISPLQGENPLGGEEYYEFRDIRNLELDLALCELHIRSHEEDYIAVCADNVRDYFHCSQQEDTLFLKDQRPGSLKSGSMDHALLLDLYLPEHQFDKFCLELGVGELTLDDLAADDVEIENGVGNISIQTLSCRELDLESGVGELQASSILASGEAGIELGTGNIIISDFDGPCLDLNCGMGNAEVTAAGRESDYNYQLEAALGSICLNHHQEHGGNHDGGGCLNIQHDADRDIHIVCAFGNAELNFTEE